MVAAERTPTPGGGPSVCDALGVPDRGAATPAVTVVVATRNRAHLLGRLVAALEAQQLADPFEVVLVDDASTDDTPAVLADLAATTSVPVQVLRQPRRRGPGPGRNRGWRAGRAPLVAFTDDDCVPRPGWLAGLVDALGEADVAQGVTVPAPDQAHHRGPFSRTLEITSPSPYFETCNMGYRRTLLEELDGFDEAFDRPAGEDTDLGLRALDGGARLAFAPAAVVEHDVRPADLRAELRDAWRWQGNVAAIGKHPSLAEHAHSRRFWKPSHPPTLVALLGLGTAAVLRRRSGIPIAAVALTPYLRHRLRLEPVSVDRAVRLRTLGHAFAVDSAEVLALAWGSVRYRRLFL
jgi:MYXO-CTERM domain-containing protein